MLELILDRLKVAHLEPGSTSCATCWMRDCCSIAVSARKWLKYARVALYEDIQLNGPDAPQMKKRMKGLGHGRLLLLRRTLRANQQIAAVVHSLKVPAVVLAGTGLEEYHDVVASIIMACPNFEKLTGFYPGYDHAFSRLFRALSTRTRLKEMNWIVEPSPFQRQHRVQPSGSGLLTPGDLQPFQSAGFEASQELVSSNKLTLHCLPGATVNPDTMLERHPEGAAIAEKPAYHTCHRPRSTTVVCSNCRRFRSSPYPACQESRPRACHRSRRLRPAQLSRRSHWLA